MVKRVNILLGNIKLWREGFSKVERYNGICLGLRIREFFGFSYIFIIYFMCCFG